MQARFKPTDSHQADGFTLVEMLVAAAMGAIVLTALAAAGQFFGSQLEYVRAEGDGELEECVVAVSDAVRYGWLVDRPSSSSLVVTDPYGNATNFALSGGSLGVTRPSGDSGVLLDGIQSLTFDVGTRRRLRELDPIQAWDVWFERTTSSSLGIAAEDDHQIALGFYLPTKAPDGVKTLADIDEEYISALIETMTLPIEFIDGTREEFWHLHATSGTIPAQASNAVVLSIDLYEARSLNDARPYGPVLDTVDFKRSAFVNGSWDWVDTDTGLTVTPPSGSQYAWWAANPQVQLRVDYPRTLACLDMPGFSEVIEPGRPYTLVFRVTGYGLITLRAQDLPSAGYSGVAAGPSGALEPVAQKVKFKLKGQRAMTQTAEHQVIDRVSMTVTTDEGQTLTSSTNVVGQHAVPNPWFGPVPGELATLQLAGQ